MSDATSHSAASPPPRTRLNLANVTITSSSTASSSASSPPATPLRVTAPSLAAGAQARLDRTAEKINPRVDSPTAGPAPEQRHRSRGGSSAESHDYVDELASSAFRDCRSAAAVTTQLGTVGSPPPLASPPAGARATSTVAAATAGPSAASPSSLRVRTFRANIDDDDDDTESGTGAQPRLNMTGLDDSDQLLDIEVSEDDHHADTRAEAPPQDTTLEEIVPAAPEPAYSPQEEVSADTSSGSPRGVWKAVYGRDRWAAQRTSLPRDDLSAQDSAGVAEQVTAVETPAVPSAEQQQQQQQSRHADSSEWAAARTTALAQLRAQLEVPQTRSSSAVASVPHRDAESRGHPLPPSDSFAGLPAASPSPHSSPREQAVPPPARSAQRTAATVLDELLRDSSGSVTGPTSKAPSALHGRLPSGEAGDRQLNPSPGTAAPAGAPVSAASTDSSSSSDDNAPFLRGAEGGAASSGSHSTGRFVVRPVLSTEVSGLSPIRNEVPSILAELYTSPESHDAAAGAAAAVSLSPHLAGAPDGRSPTPSSLPRGRVEVASRRSLQGALDVVAESSMEGDVGAGEDGEADFRTAVTAPSSSAAPSIEVTPTRDTLNAAAGHPPRVVQAAAEGAAAPDAAAPELRKRAPRLYHASPYDRRRVRPGALPETLGSGGADAAAGLRPDVRVAMFPAAATNAWDEARVSRWRSTPDSKATAAPHVASGGDADPVGSTPTRPVEWRQRRMQQEMRAKEMAECTFRPVLSPGTRAMVRLVQEQALERTLGEEDNQEARRGGATGGPSSQHTGFAGSVSPGPTDASALKATLQTVYERLYPAELSAAASRREVLDQEMEYRRLAREELILLRRRCGATPRRVARRSSLHSTTTTNGSNSNVGHGRGGGGGAVAGAAARAGDTSFAYFMSTILQTDWEKAAAGSGGSGAAGTTRSPSLLTATSLAARMPRPAQRSAPPAAPTAVVDTSYKSPMAVALLEEQYATRRYNFRREAEMQVQHPDAFAGNTDAPRERGSRNINSSGGGVALPAGEESFRVALFDEFLLRQNAYYLNRARTISKVEQSITPAFTPSTTKASARLVQKMVSRSLLNESMGPETSSIVAQHERQRIPFTASFVKQHSSPYVDPCTFHPNLSPSARAAKAEERERRRASNQAPETHQQSFFERLHNDHKRLTRQREAAKQKAEEEEVAGLTFRPAVNTERNARVHSTLSPQHYQPYQNHLQQKRASLDSRRQELEAEAKQAEEELCTFRPQTSKPPAYIAKMAKSFGVLRHQDAEF